MHILDLKQQSEHLPTLASWHHQQWSYLNPENSLQSRIENMQFYLADPFVPSTFIALRHGLLLGSAAIVAHDMDNHRAYTPWLASVFVAPEFRRQGIASKLVLHVMSMARQVGIKNLYLFTPDQVAFYKKLGWFSISSESYHGHEVVIMQINLQHHELG